MRPLVRAGDLVFIRSTGLISKLIRWGSGPESQVSHCALLLDNLGAILEANVSGVEETDLWQKYARETHEIAIYRPINLKPEVKAQMLWEAEKHLGTRYGFIAIVQQLIDRKLFKGRVVLRALNIPGVEICSELIIDIFNSVGLYFGMKPGEGSPEDMYRFCKTNVEAYAPVWILGSLKEG